MFIFILKHLPTTNKIKIINLNIIKFTRSTRATEHPKVPAPSNKHEVFFITNRSKSGCNLHFTNLRFKSTARDDNLIKN